MRNLNAQEVVRLYEGGYTMAELATHYRCSSATIWRLLHQHDANIRAGGKRPTRHAQVYEMMQMRKEGKSWKEVGAAYGVTRQAAWDLCDRYRRYL